MKKSLSLICVVISLLFASFSFSNTATTDEMLQQGNLAYSNNLFSDAIRSYRAAIAQHGLSASLLNNLGSSYAQDGQYGQAILQFERGLRLDPNNDDLLGNIALVRNHIGIFPERSSFMARLAEIINMNQWISIALGGYSAVVLLEFFIYLFPGRRFLSWLAILAFVISGISLMNGIAQHDRWEGGIIIAPEAKLLLSPFDNANARGTLPEGSLVTCLKRHLDFCYIDDNSGHSGWIALKNYRPINVKAITYSHEYAE